MPVKSLLLGSAGLLVVFLAPAHAQIAVPDFGGTSPMARAAQAGTAPLLASSAPAAPNFASAPTPVPAPMPMPLASPAAPARPGANPFEAAPAAASAPQPAAGAAPASPFTLQSGDAKAGDAANAPSGPDESGLRYYASQRDMARVGTEIRRLKSLYPNWQPPADLFATGVKINEQPIWDLFAAGDYAGADALLRKLKGENSGWEPSADLTEKLGDAMARGAIAAAAGAAQWQTVVDQARQRPGLLTCGHIDVLWTLGEALARVGDPAHSYDAYSYILGNCEGDAERLATVQKASAVLPPQGAEALAGLGRRMPDGRGEFDTLRFDNLRGQMGRVAARESSTLPDAAQLKAFADYIGKSRSASDAALFGWYFFGQEQWKDANGWFKAAAQLDTDPKHVEGQILSLRNDGAADAATSLAYDNRDRSPEIAKIFVEMVSERLTSDKLTPPDAEMMARFPAVVESTRSALGAQSLGWYKLGQADTQGAQAWFRKSVDWEATSEGVMGLAVTAARAKDKKALDEVQTAYAERFPEIRELKAMETATAPREKVKVRQVSRRGGGGGRDSLLKQAQTQFDAGDYKSALATLDQHEKTHGHNRGAEILKGWTNLKMSRYSEARAIFKAEDKRGSTRDTRFGIGATFNSQYNSWR